MLASLRASALVLFFILFSLLEINTRLFAQERLLYVFSNQEVQKDLDNLSSNPTIYQETPPLKKNGFGRLITREFSHTPPQKKFSWRHIFMPWRGSRSVDSNIITNSEPNSNDADRDLMEDAQYVETIQAMDQLRTGQANVKPWSDDYWAYYRGGAAARYADPGFPNSQSWQVNSKYISQNPFYIFFPSGKINSLSATEKYDLLYDRTAGMLTASSWADGASYFKETGNVETWMGLCHGWAPASYLAPRPKRAVDVIAFDGRTTIRFYPSDIKALTTLLWANTRLNILSAGGRCNERSPRTDAVGRTVNPDCRDTNPSTWHRAIVNRLGLNRRSFIMDSTWDYQVWNQPLISYRYRYFNPRTNSLSPNLKSAALHISQMGGDRLARYRARGVNFIVGISMEVTYGMEKSPDHRENDGPEFDQIRTVLYNYDLELNSTGVVIGGEWHKKLHPDFIWTPTKDSRPVTQNDLSISGEALWDGKSSIPNHWKQHARNAAGHGQPLSKIIDSLNSLSEGR
ncbi:MAG: hypothetical protein A4S09_05425 [Proteobacteria bacterium SG_bin7]|nr:MAG: hypothetical protein A4S09_05425 [Proteobacteria bacterium SG_bin7]